MKKVWRVGIGRMFVFQGATVQDCEEGGRLHFPSWQSAPPASVKDMEQCQTAVLLENKRPDVQCDALLDGECRSRDIAID